MHSKTKTKRLTYFVSLKVSSSFCLLLGKPITSVVQRINHSTAAVTCFLCEFRMLIMSNGNDETLIRNGILCSHLKRCEKYLMRGSRPWCSLECTWLNNMPFPLYSTQHNRAHMITKPFAFMTLLWLLTIKCRDEWVWSIYLIVYVFHNAIENIHDINTIRNVHKNSNVVISTYDLI